MPLVIAPEQMRDGGVPIVNRRDVLSRLVTKIISRTIAESALHSGAGHPHRKTFQVMVAAVGAASGHTKPDITGVYGLT